MDLRPDEDVSEISEALGPGVFLEVVFFFLVLSYGTFFRHFVRCYLVKPY